MLKTNFSLHRIAVSLLLFFLWVTSAASAQELTPPWSDSGLFSTSDGEAIQELVTENTITATRLVDLDLSLLGSAEAPAEKILLNLFEGVSYSAVFKSTERNSLGSYAWIGRLEGVPFGHAVLVVTNGLLTGSISSPEGHYEVRYAGNGVHAIHQINQAAFPPELEPVAFVSPAQTPAQVINSDPDSCEDIQVLVAYSPETRAAAGGTAAIEALIALAVVETNLSYANSGLTQRISLAHTMETTAGDALNNFGADLSALADLTDGIFIDVDSARDYYRADAVAMIIENSSSCGLGYLDAAAEGAFSVTHRTCATGNYSFGHELGHNLSAHHDWYAESCLVGGNCPYNKGYVNLAARWRTVMAYDAHCLAVTPNTSCLRLPYWSNPEVLYEGLTPMGVDSAGPTDCIAGELDPDPTTCAADNRLAQNNKCAEVANFRLGVTPEGNRLQVNSTGIMSVPIGSSSGHEGTSNYSLTLPDSTNVSLTAPLIWEGWEFNDWSGCTTSVDADCEVTISGDAIVTANYTAIPVPEIRVVPLSLHYNLSDGAAQAIQTEADPAQTVQNLNIYLRNGTVSAGQEPAPFFDSASPQSELPPGHRIIQFARIPTQQERVELKQEGIHLLQYLPNNAYWVSVEGSVSISTAEQIAGDVIWVWQPAAEYKLSRLITDDLFPEHAINPDGSVEIQVLLFDDVEQSDAETAIRSVIDTEVVKWLSSRLVVLRLPMQSIHAIAGIEWVHWVQPKSPPRTIDNATAAVRIGVDTLADPPLSLEGLGITVGVWDAGSVDAHGDFDTRLIVQDALPPHWHSTHVAGTFAGSGAGDSNARGMAPEADLQSFDWEDDLIEARAATDIDISNHSYGFVTGWDFGTSGPWVDNGDEGFGEYSADSAEWDDVVFDTGLLIFMSAGNDRDDGPDCPVGPRCDGPFDNVGTMASAKNVIAVCATDDSDEMSGFSSWGPANDGRVKPDLCANGVSVRSTDVGGGYASLNGTSMASPGAAGAGALLFQYFLAVTGQEPAPRTMKALMIHAARDLGRPGPDYEFGWGLIDAPISVALISSGAYSTGNIQDTGIMQSYTVVVPEDTDELKATLVWTDPMGSPASASALVNDLDLVLIAPDDSKYFPWVLDKENPESNATLGINNVDNVEQVVIDLPVAGVWRLQVSGGAVPLGEQAYTLVSESLAGSSADGFLIINDGDADLSITDIALESAAAWVGWLPAAPFDLSPGTSQLVTVSVNFEAAPEGQSVSRILVSSNDADESPYPGGVNIHVNTLDCIALLFNHSGGGSDPSPAPSSSVGCASGYFVAGELITLTATPANGWAVIDWVGSDDDSSNSPINQLTMPGSSTVVSVNYDLVCYPLSLSHSGSGLDLVATPPKSLSCETGNYTIGEVISLAATPDPGWQVDAWTGTDDDGSTSPDNQLTMPASASAVSVDYGEIELICYPLSLSHSGEGADPTTTPLNSSVCEPGNYLAGEVINLTAAPNEEWQLDSWSGTDDDDSTSLDNQLTMPGEASSVSVEYGLICYQLLSSHSGGGTDPTATPENSIGCADGRYVPGEVISLMAVPNSGWSVVSWIGTDDDGSTSSTNQLTIQESDVVVTVNYDFSSEVCYLLTLSHSGAGLDPVAAPANSATCPAGTYQNGEIIGLTATPDSGWTVGDWSGTDDDESGSTTNQVTMPVGASEVSVSYVEATVPEDGQTLFVPLEPCRIFDTRVVGGPLDPETTRDFRVWGDGLAQQGGTDDCGVPSTAVAVHLNFTVVNPAGSGFLRAWPFGEDEPLATLMAFIEGPGISNATALAICNTCTSDFHVKVYGATSDLVTEVVGYYQRVAASDGAD